MAGMYVVQNSDNFQNTSQGRLRNNSLKDLALKYFLHTKSTRWQMGITKGRLPYIVRNNANEDEHEAY
jgi:hypothetical protein